MSEKLDVVGIGNAMVDAIIPSNQSEIEKHDINRDSMNLIDENLKNNLHESYSIKEMVGGGSLGNSMFGITSFGGNGSFIGKIKNDEVGVHHAFVTFDDGNVEAVMAVYRYKDGKIISLETGATPMPK